MVTWIWLESVGREVELPADELVVASARKAISASGWSELSNLLSLTTQKRNIEDTPHPTLMNSKKG